MSQDEEGWEGNSSSNNPAESRESTVVVDPVSQIPEPMPRFSREPVEKTEVLKGRRIDQLRAEVHRKRKEQQRRHHKRIALWGLAGAGAVLLGALLAGFVFSGTEAVSAAGASTDQEASSSESFGHGAVEEGDVSAPGEAQGSVAQAKAPDDPEAQASVAQAQLAPDEPQAAPENAVAADSAGQADEPRQETATGSLSLDDLPPE